MNGNGTIMKDFKLQLNVFDTQQQTEEKQNEFSALPVEQQNALLKRSITGKSYLADESTFKDLEWFQKQEMPSDAQITRSIEDSYRKMNGRQIGWNERIKAKKEFKKKHKTMQKMRRNLRDQIAQSVERDQIVMDITHQEGAGEIRDEYSLLDLYQPEEKEKMRGLMSAKVLTTITNPKYIEKMSEKEKQENTQKMQKKVEVFGDTIERFEKLDISDLTFTSIEDLVQRASVMRRKAMVGFVMRKFITGEYEANGGVFPDGQRRIVQIGFVGELQEHHRIVGGGGGCDRIHVVQRGQALLHRACHLPLHRFRRRAYVGRHDDHIGKVDLGQQIGRHVPKGYDAQHDDEDDRHQHGVRSADTEFCQHC